MRASGFAIVAATFVAVALVIYAIIRAFRWEDTQFSLIGAALIATQVGTVLWHRQSPTSALSRVKSGLGILLAVTAVVFSLILQGLSGWLKYPEVVIPIAAIGCFVFPFVLAGPIWKAKSQPHGKD
jgi:hypothetical protein